jgi:S-methylmethionine-dependent homocysteine/selenocysteine methylase
MAEEFTADELTRSYAEAVELDARAAERLSQTDEQAATVEPCDIWREIRGDVVAVTKLKFIPANIRRLIEQVVDLVDRICGR